MMIYKDPDGKVLSAEEWSSMFEDRSESSVWMKARAESEIQYKEESIKVSTVWLGMSFGGDFGQFETMVFSTDCSKDYGSFTRRYRTRQESLEGHFEITKEVTDMLVEADHAWN